MIKEAYCSKEVCNLLKEKGFDEPCHAYYDDDNGKLRESYSACAIRYRSNPCVFGIGAPTQQMVMRWLREIHNVYMDIAPTHSANGPIDFVWQTYNSDYLVTGDCDIFYPTYEEAVEAAIQYSLEHLI